MSSLQRAVCVVLSVIAFQAITSRGNAEDTSRPRSFRVVGYLPDYRFDDYDPSQLKLLTDLVLFSATVNSDGKIDAAKVLDQKRLNQWRKESNKHVRFHLCVGGWERSSGFAGMSQSPEKRAAFVADAMKLCEEYRLSGIDLDWEHPSNAQEQTAYANLIKDLRKAFAPKGLSVSLTMAAWQQLPRQAFEEVDSVQIMAYDHEGKHSTMEAAKDDLAKVVLQGAHVAKITLGLPFYGRSVTNSGDTLTYRQILDKFDPAPNVDEVDHYYFNGRDTVAAKTKWARTKGLAGVMIWEVGQDASGAKSLLQSIAETVASHSDTTKARVIDPRQ